jgi:hypothetical protein
MAILPQARNRLFQLVRDFAVQTPVWGTAIRYQTRPDERFDLTLASVRVYGVRTEALVIQAAAGLDLSERPLVLPTAEQLHNMKIQAGYGNT